MRVKRGPSFRGTWSNDRPDPSSPRHLSIFVLRTRLLLLPSKGVTIDLQHPQQTPRTQKLQSTAMHDYGNTLAPSSIAFNVQMLFVWFASSSCVQYLNSWLFPALKVTPAPCTTCAEAAERHATLTNPSSDRITTGINRLEDGGFL